MPALPTRPPYQLRIGAWIVNAEARRDTKGRIAIYKLPKADGGGTFEVAGINDRYHPHQADHLRDLIQLGQHAKAEQAATEYILAYTDLVTSWTSIVAFEAFLRDCAFNRGPGGAAKILQIALDVTADGDVGPRTRRAMSAITLDQRKPFLAKLREARELYERRIAPPTGARAKFWKGLNNRWDKAHDFALIFCP
jgi:hypothetical protein